MVSLQIGLAVLLLGYWTSNKQVIGSSIPVERRQPMVPLIYDSNESPIYSDEVYMRPSKQLKEPLYDGDQVFFLQEDYYNGHDEYDEDDDDDEDEDDVKKKILSKLPMFKKKEQEKYDAFEKLDQWGDKITNKIYDKYLHIKTATPPEPPDWAKSPVPPPELPPWHKWV